jgi:hypothetical protein
LPNLFCLLTPYGVFLLDSYFIFICFKTLLNDKIIIEGYV